MTEGACRGGPGSIERQFAQAQTAKLRQNENRREEFLLPARAKVEMMVGYLYDVEARDGNQMMPLSQSEDGQLWVNPNSSNPIPVNGASLAGLDVALYDTIDELMIEESGIEEFGQAPGYSSVGGGATMTNFTAGFPPNRYVPNAMWTAMSRDAALFEMITRHHLREHGTRGSPTMNNWAQVATDNFPNIDADKAARGTTQWISDFLGGYTRSRQMIRGTGGHGNNETGDPMADNMTALNRQRLAVRGFRDNWLQGKTPDRRNMVRRVVGYGGTRRGRMPRGRTPFDEQ